MDTHGLDGHRPYEPVLESGTYAACTIAGRVMDEVFIASGSLFPPGDRIVGPGVSIRYILVKPSKYQILPS